MCQNKKKKKLNVNRYCDYLTNSDLFVFNMTIAKYKKKETHFESKIAPVKSYPRTQIHTLVLA